MGTWAISGDIYSGQEHPPLTTSNHRALQRRTMIVLRVKWWRGWFFWKLSIFYTAAIFLQIFSLSRTSQRVTQDNFFSINATMIYRTISCNTFQLNNLKIWRDFLYKGGERKDGQWWSKEMVAMEMAVKGDGRSWRCVYVSCLWRTLCFGCLSYKLQWILLHCNCYLMISMFTTMKCLAYRAH